MNIPEATEQLLEIKRIFDSLNKPFWLIAGTLLAAVRDKEFFSHDHDMDIAMLAEDWNEDFYSHFDHYFKYKPLKYGLGRTTVFDLNRTSSVRTNCMLAFRNPSRKSYIQIFPPMRDSYLSEIPMELMDTPTYIDFIGHSFRIPAQPEKVLTNIYGDWKTPVKHGVAWKDAWGEIQVGDLYKGVSV